MMPMISGLRHRHHGFSLLEVLIAVLVLSVGVLGLAGLQFFGLKEGQTSYSRSQAILLAYEIADRMRANRAAAAVAGQTTSAYSLATGTTPPTYSKDCTTVICSPVEMAAYDLSTWYARVTSLLPSGTASIACLDTCDLGRKQTVIVQWDELRTGSAGTGCSVTVTSMDGCIAIVIAP